MKRLILNLCFVSLFFIQASDVFAWGQRGHAITSTLAADLLEESGIAPGLQSQSYKLEHYSRVPDIIWKRPQTYKVESTNHYVDLEHFFSKNESMTLFKLEKLFAKPVVSVFRQGIQKKSGQNPWRILQLHKLSQNAAKKIDRNTDSKSLFKLQSDWLVLAGLQAHYIQDLAVPLHTTEYYDGKTKQQKGVHWRFESESLNIDHTHVAHEAKKQALRKWKVFHQSMKNKTLPQVLAKLTYESHRKLDKLLEIYDRSHKEGAKALAKDYKSFLIDQVAMSSLYTAEVWSRCLPSRRLQTKRFYDFVENPEYILMK